MARPSSLKIVNWNGRSVQNKHLEFFDFAQRQSIDVAVITETWLQPNINFIHPNYYCVRHDRPSCTEAGRGGGVLIAVRKGIQFHQQNISTKTIEAAEITIPSGDNYISIFLEGDVVLTGPNFVVTFVIWLPVIILSSLSEILMLEIGSGTVKTTIGQAISCSRRPHVRVSLFFFRTHQLSCLRVGVSHLHWTLFCQTTLSTCPNQSS